MILKCLTCLSFVDAQEISTYEKEITDPDYERTTFYSNKLLRTYKKYRFLKCPICLEPFLTCLIYNNDDIDNWKSFSTLYPISNKIISSDVPVFITKAFDEAVSCFENQIYTACVIMCRKAVEGVCKEHKIEKGNLKEKLVLMKNNGIIDQNLFEWADALRIFGNDAAHDLDITFACKDAEDIIEFTYAILEYVFIYRKKFEVFIERKKQKKSL